MPNKKLYDLIIIGAAAAGSAAAIYAARRNLDFVIITKNIGGEVALSGVVNNWPGIIEINGFALAQNFNNHIKSYNTKIEEGFKIKSIIKEKNYHIVNALNEKNEEKNYKTKAVIIASGIHPRNLGIPDEKEYRGKGVTYCTVCDGPLFRNKITATIGSGNAALESALMMSQIASKVYLLTKYPNDLKNKNGFPKGENILIEKVKKIKNVEIIYNSDTTQLLGNEMLTNLEYKDKETGEKKVLEIQGAMIHIGMLPNSDFVNSCTKNKAGEIEIDLKCKTNCEGIFAAGDVTNIPYKQIAIAAGHGVTAALSAIEYINRWEEKE